MNTSNLPDNHELPSKATLLKSTLIALVTAVVILVTAILPAEYGIDPTGLGRVTGLTQMGEIKVSLAREAEQEQPLLAVQPDVIPEPESTQAAEPVSVEQAAAPTETEVPVNANQRVFSLQPGEAAEIKLIMNAGDQVDFQWLVEGGTANFDTHGDAPGIRYHGYSKGRFVEGDAGVLEAAFDGKHGWFWRNRSETEITVTLNVQGEYSGIERVL